MMLVRWEIDIEAETAVEAAKKARKVQLDPDSLATMFEVKPTLHQGWKHIDLEDQP